MEGLLGFNPDDLRRLQEMGAQFGPNAADKESAKWAGLLSLGAALMGARRGRESEAIGQGLLGGFQAQQGYLDKATQDRGRNIAQALQLQQLATKDQFGKELSRILGQPDTTQGQPSSFQIPGGATGAFNAAMGNSPQPTTLPTQVPNVNKRQDLARLSMMNRASGGPGFSADINAMYPNPIAVAEGGMLFDPATGASRPNPKAAPGSFYDPTTNSMRPVQNYNELNAAAVSAEERARRQAASDFTLREFPLGPDKPGQTEWMTESQFRNQKTMPPANMPADLQERAIRDGAQLGVSDPLALKREEAKIGVQADTARTTQGGIIKQINDNYAHAYETATKTIPLLQESKAILDSGKVITGAGANFALEFGRWLSQAGFREADDPVANTQTFLANQAKSVMGSIKQLGSGSGISNSDREYAAKAQGGQIDANETAIRRILDIGERAGRQLIQKHNEMTSRASSVLGNPDVRSLYSVEMPPMGGGARPQMVTPSGAAAPAPSYSSPQRGPSSQLGGKTVTRTGTMNGRKVVEYSDGTIDYAP